MTESVLNLPVWYGASCYFSWLQLTLSKMEKHCVKWNEAGAGCFVYYLIFEALKTHTPWGGYTTKSLIVSASSRPGRPLCVPCTSDRQKVRTVWFRNAQVTKKSDSQLSFTMHNKSKLSLFQSKIEQKKA